MKLLSERLKWAMDRRSAQTGEGVRASDLARAAKAARASVNYWLHDVNGMGAKKARLAADYLGVNPIWLETGEGSPDRALTEAENEMIFGSSQTEADVEDGPEIIASPKKIPVVGRVQAGPDGLLRIDDAGGDISEGYMVWFSTCNSAYALRIRGESMSPRYLPGEFVGVDPCSDVQPSDEVIILLKDGRRMIKRLLWQRDSQACFESVNKVYQNIVLESDEIDSLHLVIGNIPKAAFRQF